MFTPDEIQSRIRARPFVPLRVMTSVGDSFDIYHPDLIMVDRRSITVGRASAENPTQYEQTTRIAILHVTALEDLPAPTTPETNGQD